MKIFITGIEGFVGGYLLDELLKNGHEVAGYHFLEDVPKKVRRTGIELIRGDVSNRESFYEALNQSKPDAVIHLAAISFVPYAHSNPSLTWKVNLWGTLNLLEWIRNYSSDTFALILSTGEIYGSPISDDELPLTENSPFRPNNMYATTKAATDLAAQQYQKVWKLNVTIARSFNHIGPGQGEVFVTSAFAKQIAQIMLNKHAPEVKVGNLSAYRDFSDVRDVVRAYRLIVEAKKPYIFNICSGKPVRIGSILDTLIEYANTNIKIEKDPSRLRPIDTPMVYGSHEKITNTLGWEPEIPLSKSLRDILDYWLKALS